MADRDVLRNEIYGWCRRLFKDGYRFEAIFLLLSTWNFAYFRYHLIDFDLESFKKTLANCDFAHFESKRFDSINLDDEEVSTRVEKIYRDLSEFKGIRYVGATKIMHLLNPALFMMWDTKIIEKYQELEPDANVSTSPRGYLNFMRMLQKKYNQGEFHKLDTQKFGIPFAIDHYNYDLAHEED